jgi:hypothetical protein
MAKVKSDCLHEALTMKHAVGLQIQINLNHVNLLLHQLTSTPWQKVKVHSNQAQESGSGWALHSLHCC